MSVLDRRRFPFSVAAGVLAIVSVAVARLPQDFVAGLERDRPLGSGAATVLYWSFVLIALGQALYGGFVLLDPSRVRKARERDPELRARGKNALMSSIARTGAFTTCLTLAYGIAAFVLTGERGGFWTFVLIAAAQEAWYYRQVGVVGHKLELLVDVVTQPRADEPEE